MAEQPYQSLYRRYRPQRFAEVRGQDHVTRALRNSVRNGTVHHAYLFSGPRGTGKTSTARILAKALNCLAPEDGEPCCRCESCLAVAAGSSMDVHELDAASNNGVDAMRDLVARAALGTPGRWKVYIVDEVHMLSAAASNALLKTLEEPPGHVIFVLATTDPQKVLDTIKSRTQHFEFHLLGGELLSHLLHDISADAALGVAAEAIDLAVRRGRGSARDALSFLDQVAAAGVVEDESETLDRLIEALAEADPKAVLAAVAEAHGAGRDPQRLGADLLSQLRYGFLATMAPDLVPLPDTAREQAAEQARRLGTPTLVRAMETIGQALVEMRDAVDPRVHLEVALIRLARPDAPAGGEGLRELVERLEHRVAQLEARLAGAADPAPSATPPGSTAPGREPTARGTARSREAPTRGAPAPGGEPGSGPAAGARAALGALRTRPPAAGASSTSGPAATTTGGREGVSGSTRNDPETPARPPGAATADPPSAASGPFPSRDDIVKAWGDGLLAALPGRPRARYRLGRFVEAGGGEAVFAVPNEPHRRFCEECRTDVEDVLSSHFGVRVPIRLVVVPDQAAPGAAPPPEDEAVDPDDLVDAPAAAAPASPEERIRQAFPGATEVGG